MDEQIVEENLCGVTIRRRVLPHRIRDPLGIWLEEAKWIREFEKNVGLPVAAAMAERIDRLWSELRS